MSSCTVSVILAAQFSFDVSPTCTHLNHVSEFFVLVVGIRLHSFLLMITTPYFVVRSLGGNNLGPEGGRAIADALNTNTTLTTLK